jgi:hypothetical protein
LRTRFGDVRAMLLELDGAQVFFKLILCRSKKHHTEPMPLFVNEPRADLVQREIGLLRNEIEQPLLMLLQRRPTVALASQLVVYDAW